MRKAASGNGISSKWDFQGVPNGLVAQDRRTASEKEYDANSALDSGVGCR